eukprot:TRINITY_DN15022_c0_g1_i2.p1 TRINITY_DN15022_c0_g1~~TRINITY_DN15022_c0_g1_i2.p1  ORF type:complete len:208 (+),score=63.51 TRINITY_DN15022_c0_g1_i2:334-957(+)
MLRPLLFSSEEAVKGSLKRLAHKNCIVFIATHDSLHAYAKACLSINEELDTDISILFYVRQGDCAKDSANENAMGKYALEGEKLMEVVGDVLDPEAEYVDPPISPEDEKLGMPRVVEALECNMWASMVKIPMKKPAPKTEPNPNKEEIKKAGKTNPKEQPLEEEKKSSNKELPKEEEREEFDPSKDYEKETDEFESLMHELLKVRET